MSRENATNRLPNDTPGNPSEAPSSRVSPPKNPAFARLTVSKAEAAASLGVSVDFLESHVMADLRVVRKGRLVLIPVRELEAWVSSNAAALWGAA